MNTKIRVGVVDDHPLYRDGVVHTLTAQSDIEVVGQGASAQDAIRIAFENEPDVLVIDMNIPGGGMAAIEAITVHRPTVKILVLTMVTDEDQVCSALNKGVCGYLLKGSSGGEVIQTLRVVSEGERYVAPSLAAKLLMRSDIRRVGSQKPIDRFSKLTPREEQVLSILVEGRSNKEIGNKLELSEKTIKHHLTSILQKLHVRNRVEAALLASDRTSYDRGLPVESGAY